MAKRMKEKKAKDKKNKHEKTEIDSIEEKDNNLDNESIRNEDLKAESKENSDTNTSESEKPKKKKKDLKKAFAIMRLSLFIVFFIIFVFSLVNIIRWAIFNKRSKEDIENVKTSVIRGSFDKNKENEDDKLENPINFEELKNINSDAVAWIRIKDTSINYPIVQAKDNDYYLHKDINKKYSTCGWIFMDWQNSETFIDKNTVIYGHNIKSGVMFADLLKIQRNQLGKDITIEIYTPDEKLEYKVYSSYMIEPEGYAIKSNIVTEDVFQDYLKTMIGRSTIDYNIMPTTSDKVLTLSTCDNSGQNRVLIHAVLINEEKFDK